MNIKFGMDNYYVRYLKRFLNHELNMSNRVLGDFNKIDQHALINYLNLPNVKNMFEVQKELLDQFADLSTLFNVNLRDNKIIISAREISLNASNWISNNLESIDTYCKSVGWYISDVNEWYDENKDINQDGYVNEDDNLIIYNIVHGLETYDETTTKRADLDLDGSVTQADLDIMQDYLSSIDIYITLQQEERQNYFPNEDMKVFINQFDGTFMYNYAIRDNGYGPDDLPHINNTGNYKIALYQCTPGQKITISHSSNVNEHLVIGSSNATLKDNIKSVMLQNVVEIDLQPGKSYQYTATSHSEGTGYDAHWICIQCPSSYVDLQGGETRTLILERGDINFDGKIDMEDYLILADYTAEGPGASDLPYNKANWTPSSKQLAVMDIPIPGQGGQSDVDGEITVADAQELYAFITGQSTQPSLGLVAYTYTVNSTQEVISDNVADLLIIDGHYANNVNIPFKEFITDPWIVHDKFFNYLLDMSVHQYTNSEDITYMQKLLKAYYPESKYEKNYFSVGTYNKKMRDLVYQYQREHTNYTIGDLNIDGKLNNDDLILERYIIETLNADINGDGKIDQDDFDLLLNYINGTGTLTPEQLIKADVNFDGVINNDDLAIIQEYINGTRQDTVHDENGNLTSQAYLADINQDGKWTREDYEMLQQQINGEIDVLTNYNIPFMLGYIDVETEALLESEYNYNGNISEVSK
jgi:hypothetical protein